MIAGKNQAALAVCALRTNDSGISLSNNVATSNRFPTEIAHLCRSKGAKVVI